MRSAPEETKIRCVEAREQRSGQDQRRRVWEQAAEQQATTEEGHGDKEAGGSGSGEEGGLLNHTLGAS